MTRTCLINLLILLIGLPMHGVGSEWRGTTGILHGRVRDQQLGESLVGVNVVVVGTTFGGVTDVNGEYQINNVRAGVYDVRFSYVGYKTVIVTKITILPDLRTKIDVELEASTIEARPVEIRG